MFTTVDESELRLLSGKRTEDDAACVLASSVRHHAEVLIFHGTSTQEPQVAQPER
jgi:hypothetical protein